MARVGHQDLHQEAVELRFRQRIGAFHLDGVLSGHHQEWTVELVSGGAAGDGALLHGFEQRRLRLGSGAIDFVGQHQVGENGSLLEAQSLASMLFGFDDHAAHDVGGHEIGRELDAGILQREGAREGSKQRGLAQAGNAFQEHVSPGKQTDQHAFHHIVLTDDDFGDFLAHDCEPVHREFEGRFGCHVVIVVQTKRTGRGCSAPTRSVP